MIKKELIYKEDVIAKAWLDNECEVVSLYEIEEMRPVAIVSGVLHICPVCQGKGFLPGNFYELPGKSVSYAGYMNLASSSVVCRSCLGKGFLEINKSD